MVKHTAEMHKGHRQRLRERYDREGIFSLEDYRALELFLFNIIPVRDTYPLAHNLLKRFGSLSGVLGASREELCTVDGIGQKTADYIKFANDFMQRAIAGELSNKPFNTPEQITCYLIWTMRYLETDAVVVMYLNKNNLLLECKDYSTPENSYSNVYDDIREKAKENKKLKIIVAHKHPEENTVSSFIDKISTETLMRVCKENNVTLIEHYVVSGYSLYGIVENDIKTKNAEINEILS